MEIKIEDQDFQTLMEKVLEGGNPHKKLIAKVLTDHLRDRNIVIQHLILAILGIEVKAKFKVGEKVMCHRDGTPYWRMDEPRCKKELFIKDYMEVEIVRVEMCLNAPYTYKISYYTEGKDDLYTEEASTNDFFLKKKTDSLDILEDI